MGQNDDDDVGDGGGCALRVSVTSPEKLSDGGSALGRFGKTFVAFEVAFQAAGGPFGDGAQGAPRRRFRDFVALADRLVRCV